MKKNASRIYEQVMEKGGHFYVCGDVSMAADVTTTLQDILRDNGHVTEEQAKTYVINMRVRLFIFIFIWISGKLICVFNRILYQVPQCLSGSSTFKIDLWPLEASENWYIHLLTVRALGC